MVVMGLEQVLITLGVHHSYERFLTDRKRRKVVFCAKWRGVLFEVAGAADFDLRFFELRRNVRSLTCGEHDLRSRLAQRIGEFWNCYKWSTI